MEGRIEFFGRRRVASVYEPGASSQRGKSFYQLVPVAQRPDRITKTWRRRRSGELAAHRYSQRRHPGGKPLAVRREVLRCGETGIWRHETDLRSSEGDHGGCGEREVELPECIGAQVEP